MSSLETTPTNFPVEREKRPFETHIGTGRRVHGIRRRAVADDFIVQPKSPDSPYSPERTSNTLEAVTLPDRAMGEVGNSGEENRASVNPPTLPEAFRET